MVNEHHYNSIYAKVVHRETSRNIDEIQRHGARAGDRCIRDRDNCAHLGVVNRVHNKCVWVRGRAAWHTRCGARRVSRRTTEYECAHLRGRRPAEWRGSGALPDPGCAPTAAGPQTNRTPSDIGLSCHLPKMTQRPSAAGSARTAALNCWTHARSDWFMIRFCQILPSLKINWTSALIVSNLCKWHFCFGKLIE